MRRTPGSNLLINKFITTMAMLSLCCLASSTADAQNQVQEAGLGPAVVHTALGGQILGYDIQQNGTEGLLSEFVALADGKSNVAVETFDQKSGKILKIISQQNDTFNDFVTLGIFGGGAALVEEQLSKGMFVDKTLYGVMNPLDGNNVTGKWTPPFTKNDIIISMPDAQGSPNTAVLYFDNGGGFNSFVLGTNVTANTFGTPVTITDPDFSFNVSPVMTYDSQTNTAVLGGSLGCFGCTTQIGLVDLTKGTFSEFGGLGFGFINGIAVDSANGIVCTATEDDFSIEIYNLATKTGFIVPLQGAN